jgi:hypothetical protein
MKKAILILTGIILAGCGVNEKLSDMGQDTKGMRNDIHQTAEAAKAMAEKTEQMAEYMRTLVDALQKIIGGGGEPQPSPTPGVANFITNPNLFDQIDLSTKTVQELTLLRDELKKAVSYKAIFAGQFPNLIKFIKEQKIKTPDASVDPAKAALIVEIKSLILQL